ncbi:hypothetical protein CWATWH0003_5510b1, partial [Crocosphaera watsonii WH 0003]
MDTAISAGKIWNQSTRTMTSMTYFNQSDRT